MPPKPMTKEQALLNYATLSRIADECSSDGLNHCATELRLVATKLKAVHGIKEFEISNGSLFEPHDFAKSCNKKFTPLPPPSRIR